MWNFRESNTETLVISERLKFPYDDQTGYKFFIAQLRKKNAFLQI